MNKSIFSRLLISNLSILLTLILTLSISLSFLYSNHIYRIEKERLANIALKTEMLYYNLKDGLINESTLQDYIDAMSYVSKSKLYIININSTTLNNLESLQLADEDINTYLYQDLKDISNGNEVFRNSQFTKTFDTRMIFYGRPIIDNNTVSGGIILFSPITSVSHNIKIMIWIIAGVSLIAFIIVAGVLFISARKITEPLKLVRDCALKIANNEATEDIENYSYDELNELIEAFNYMKSELIRIESDKKEFISIISHELKTPLTVISGYLEAIHDGVLNDEEVTESLDIIYKESIRLTKLTKDIVTQTTNKDPDFFLEPAIFKLRPLLEELILMYQINPSKHIEFSLSCDENILLYADENKIRQILTNLITNSIKYSYESVKIDISCVVDFTQLCLSLKDNGIGIKKSDLQKVFNKYYRVKNIYNSLEGSGLGLNIVKKLIELHKGTISIASEPKKGTTIKLYFPL